MFTYRNQNSNEYFWLNFCVVCTKNNNIGQIYMIYDYRFRWSGLWWFANISGIYYDLYKQKKWYE